jgi:glycosyltransferase involved in cell wall biosynthesis
MAFIPMPKVSLITITYNAEKYLERTIQSIIRQTYPHIEYLIIDGGSKDGTLAIIRKYENHITRWVSEPDKGIYDAMNKGLNLATGDFIWYMNAGDEIYAADTLEKIFAQGADADVYYGETEFRDLEGNYLGLRSEVTPLKLPENLTWRDLQMGLLVCHQALLVGKSIAVQYDLDHFYSADTDWVIRCLKKAQKTVHTHQVLAIYLQGGFSRRNLRQSLLDRFAIMQKHFGFLRTVWNHLRIIFRSIRFILTHRKGY